MGIKEMPLHGYLKIIHVPTHSHFLSFLLHILTKLNKTKQQQKKKHTTPLPEIKDKRKEIIQSHLYINITKLIHHSCEPF